jgi:HEAT repeat protein
MGETEDKFERQLADWRECQLSLEDTRDLARELGQRKFERGVPILLKLLDDSDYIVRYNAVVSIGFDLHQESAAKRLLVLAENDEDDDCRRAAAAVGNLLQNSRDPRALSALGKLARSDPDEDVRRAAYKSLLIVNGVTQEEHLNLIRDNSIEVDAEIVEQILSSVRGGPGSQADSHAARD